MIIPDLFRGSTPSLPPPLSSSLRLNINSRKKMESFKLDQRNVEDLVSGCIVVSEGSYKVCVATHEKFKYETENRYAMRTCAYCDCQLIFFFLALNFFSTIYF